MPDSLTVNIEFSKFCRNYMALKKELPIRPSEMGLLSIMMKTPGPHTPVLLAEMLGVSKPMIAAHLSSLTKKGYVTRQQSSTDKRVFHIQLTEKAKKLVARMDGELNELLARFNQQMRQGDFDLLVKLIGEANRIMEAGPAQGEHDS